MIGADLAAEVTTPEPYVVPAEGEHRFTVAALDLGIKRNVPRRLAARGVETHVLPATVHAGRPAGGRPGRGLLLQRPGRPGHRRPRRSRWRGRCCGGGLPLFGICFGSQILGRALGFGTYKLQLRPPGHQPAGAGPDHRQGRGDRAQPRLRGRRAAATAAIDTDVRRGSR